MPRRKENPRLATFNKLIKAGKSTEKDILNLKIEDLKDITEDSRLGAAISDIAEQELREKLKKLDEINAELKINENGHEILGNEPEEKEDIHKQKKVIERC